MKDKSDKQDRSQLARDLELEYDAIVGQSESATGDAEIERRLQSVKPALDLLNEFRDQPELVQILNVSQAERETQASQKTVTNFPQEAASIGLSHPKQIGRFGIIEQVGQGGLGVVYRARDPQLNRDVAIKVPLAGALISSGARDRFVTEAKAAAALAHPQIVTVFESGQIGPVCYLACEFVEGPTLASWLAEHDHSLTPDTAAGFIASLADALQHAHSRGVIHRDIKPGNILLDAKSGILDEQNLRQAARISDFGLAKLLDEDSAQTRTGSVVGTPAYMAPEQVHSGKKAVGPQTDVYAMGLMLYELLTQTNPFVQDSIIKTISAVQNKLPVPPRSINGTVPPDLNAVVVKCLEKQPAARYQTAAELRDDLERYLNREPVRARQVTVLSRTGKWIRRNPVVTAMIFTLVFGILGTAIGLIRARHAEAEAKVEALTAHEVSEFMEELFDIPDFLGRHAGELSGRDVTVEDVLLHAAEKIQTELGEQPIVKARLMARIGSSLVAIESYDKAETLLGESLRLREENLSAGDSEIADSYRHLGVLMREIERHQEAEQYLRKAISILEPEPEQNHKSLSGALNDLGILLRPTDPAAAKQAYVQARDLMYEYQPDFEGLWALNANIAVIDYLAGRYDMALDAFERSLAAAENTLGPDHPRVATLIGNLSKIHMNRGNYREAKAMRLKDISITERGLGNDHSEFALGLIGLVEVNQRLGELTDAMEDGQKAIEILRNTLPAHHGDITKALSNHLVTLMRLGEFDAALEILDEIESSASNENSEHVKTSSLRMQVLRAQIERQKGDLKNALDTISAVLEEPTLDQSSVLAMDARFAKALALADLNDASAVAEFENALQLGTKLPGFRPQNRAYVEAQFWALMGKTELAGKKLTEAVDAGYKDARLFTDHDLEAIKHADTYRDAANRVRDALGLTGD